MEPKKKSTNRRITCPHACNSSTDKARAGRNLKSALSLALCSSMLISSTYIDPAKAQSAEEPKSSLMLPLTPKLDMSYVDSSDESDQSDQEISTKSKRASMDSVSLKGKQLDAEIELDESPLLDAALAGQDPDSTDAYESEVNEDTTLKGTIQIVADDTEFDQENNTFLGSGNAVAIIGGQNAKLEADMILYNQNDDIIDARGNVRIIREGQVTTGGAFRFKVSSDEYLLTDPDTEINGTTVVARRALGTGKGMTFKDGKMGLPEPLYIARNAMFGPGGYSEEVRRKAQHPDAYLPAKPSFNFSARKMVYEKYKESGNLTVFGGRMGFGQFSVPVPKFNATINNSDTNVVFPVTPMLSNNMQIGGMHIGPKFNQAVGRTGVLSWAPLLQIGGRDLATGMNPGGGSGIGLAGQASFTTDRLKAGIGAGSVNNLMAAELTYRIRKRQRFQGGINRFIEDGMFGWRRARMQAELVDNRGLAKVPFLTHVNFRSSAGWYQDNPQLVNLNPDFADLFGGTQTSTIFNSAFKLQEQITAGTHPILNIGDDKVGFKANIMGGTALRAYSTGDMNLLGQIGPNIDLRLNKARFQMNYMQSAMRGDEGPFVFDRFIQGQRSVGFSGDVKVSKYLTLGGGLGYNLNNKLFFSRSMTAALGPEDFKVLVTTDMITGNNRLGFDVLYGNPINFKSLVLKGAADHGNLGGL